MQKVINFLEQNVQWVALGLGGLFFLWMTWGNVITPPASVMAGGRSYTAGEVDQLADDAAQRLQMAMNSGGTLDVQVPDVRTDLDAKLNPAERSPFSGQVFASKTFKPEAPGDPGTIPPKPGQPPIPQQAKIANLPVLPPAEPYGVSAGVATVELPAQPGAPVQPNVQLVAGPVDQLWATASFTVPMGQIAKEFADKKIPQALSKTEFLQVELVREEQAPDGTWGNSKVIAPAAQALPMLPFPVAGQKGMEIGYKQWADQNQVLIIQPPFYKMTAGTPWQIPGVVIPVIARPFDPAHDVARTPEEKEIKKKYEQEQFKIRAEAAKSRAKSAGRSSGRTSSPRGGSRAAPAGDGNVANAPRAIYGQPVGGAGVANGDLPPVGNDENAGVGGPTMQSQPQGLPPEIQKMLGPITTIFDPAAVNDKILVWAHDVTVEPGKTYRYKIKYRMGNPLYMANNAAAPALINQFDLVSGESKWTDAIIVPSMTQFFVRQGIAPNGTSATFDIYRWQNGQMWTKVQSVQVGDVVGGLDGIVDYTTDWTVVDLRPDVRGASSGYVLLMDSAGHTMRRDHITDGNNAKYKEMKDQFAPKGPNGQPLAARP